MGRAMAVVSTVLVIALAVLLALLLGLRGGATWARDAVRALNRAYFNPRQMRTAGTKGAYASVIRHVGRTSGRPYETPVGAVEIADGFVIGLPYGAGADWVRNVLASGSATILHEGRSFEVDRPQVVPHDDVADVFPPADRRAQRIFGVSECLRLRRTVA